MAVQSYNRHMVPSSEIFLEPPQPATAIPAPRPLLEMDYNRVFVPLNRNWEIIENHCTSDAEANRHSTKRKHETHTEEANGHSAKRKHNTTTPSDVSALLVDISELANQFKKVGDYRSGTFQLTDTFTLQIIKQRRPPWPRNASSSSF